MGKHASPFLLAHTLLTAKVQSSQSFCVIFEHAWLQAHWHLWVHLLFNPVRLDMLVQPHPIDLLLARTLPARPPFVNITHLHMGTGLALQQLLVQVSVPWQLLARAVLVVARTKEMAFATFVALVWARFLTSQTVADSASLEPRLLAWVCLL
jgi:hypothetical protein